jgi:leucyl aminopeptidase
MKTELLFTPAASFQTEILAVFAADNSTSKDKDAKPEVSLLTADDAVRKAANFVLATGEFKAEANETLLLHAPEGLAATRLLIVGLGKTAKADPHIIRRAAGTAVRFAKPRGIRSLSILVPEGNFDSTQSIRAIAEGAILAKTAVSKHSRSSFLPASTNPLPKQVIAKVSSSPSPRTSPALSSMSPATA